MVSDEQDNSQKEGVIRKVRQQLKGLFRAPSAIVFVLALAAFYAWNLLDIYADPLKLTTDFAREEFQLTTLVSSLSNTIGYVLIALFLSRLKSFPRIATIAAVLVCLTTILSYTVSTVFLFEAQAVSIAYRAIGRLGAACVIVYIGMRFNELDSGRITAFTLAAFLVSCLIYLLIDSMQGIILVLFVAALLPLAMIVQRFPMQESNELPHLRNKQSFIGMTWRITLVFAVFGIVTWIVIMNAQMTHAQDSPMGLFVISGTFIIVLVLFILTLLFNSTFSNSYVYKLVLPLIIVGVLFITAFNFDYNFGPSLVSIGFTCFDMFCFAMIINACKQTKTRPGLAFGLFRAIESSTPALAILVMSATEVFFVDQSTLVVWFGIICIVVLVASLLFDQHAIFDRGHLDPTIEYPQVEVFHFAKQCKKVILRYGLSARESEVLNLLVRGRSVPHIAERLLISHSTVKTHITRIYQKLGVASKQEMIDLIEAMPLEEAVEHLP